GARPVGYACRVAAPDRAHRHRMGISPSARIGVNRTNRALALLLFCSVAHPALAQETHLIVIVGSAGDQEHSDKFHKWATTLIDAARRQDGVADGNIIYLAEKPEIDPSRIGGRSTRENVEKTFAGLSVRVAPNDQIFVVLFGHGSFDGRKATFNVPGPDLTAEDYARLLDKLA